MVRADRRIALVWLALLTATLCSWEWGRYPGDHRVANAAVMLIGFIKARFIGLEFMELRLAPRALRFLFETWVALGAASLIALTWFAPE